MKSLKDILLRAQYLMNKQNLTEAEQSEKDTIIWLLESPEDVLKEAFLIGGNCPVDNTEIQKALTTAKEQIQTLKDELLNTEYERDRIKEQLQTMQNEQKTRETADNDAEIRRMTKQLQKANDKLVNAQNEVAQKKERIALLEHALEKKKEKSPEEYILTAGQEQEKYPGEITDLILDSLKEYEKTLPQISRRKDIIEDILKNNSESGERTRIVSELTKCLEGGSKKGAMQNRTTFERLGLEYRAGGKHDKLFLHGDERYAVSMSCSASDTNSGKNLLRTIIDAMF